MDGSKAEQKPRLPDVWVDRLFAELVTLYGRAFLDQYEGLSIEHIKRSWAERLAGFERNPGAIRFAIEHLPPRPVNVIQFASLAMSAPSSVKALTYTPQTKMTAEQQAVMDTLRKELPLRLALGTIDRRTAWARSLKAREEKGERLTEFQRECWRRTLKHEEAPEDSAFDILHDVEGKKAAAAAIVERYMAQHGEA